MRLFQIDSPMLLKLLFSAIFSFAVLPLMAQEDAEKVVRESRNLMSAARDALKEEDFSSAEAYYRKAISKDPANAEARYNLGNLYHNENLIEEALERDGQAAKVAEEKTLKHKSFHNKGNAHMQQKKYPEAIEAYKDALRNNPTDEETRYNLALAKKLWEKEKQDGGDGESENKEGDQPNDQQEKKEQEGDQGEQDQEGNPQDQEGGEQQDQRQQDPKEEGEGKQPKEQEQGEGEQPKETQPQQPQQQQPVPGQLSPQQIKSLLEAMGNEEKKVQEKMNAEKVKGVPTRAAKDW